MLEQIEFDFLEEADKSNSYIEERKLNEEETSSQKNGGLVSFHTSHKQKQLPF